MRQTMTCAAALLVAACGADAVPTNAVAASDGAAGAIAAVSTAAAAQPENWTGEYEGSTDGGKGSLSIRPSGANRYNVAMETFSGDGCSGEVEGGAIAAKGQLVMTAPVPDDSGRVCRVVLTNAGKSVRASSTDCSYFHGMGCGFDGTFAKKGNPVQSAPSGTAVVGGARGFMEEGGAVGCSNGAVDEWTGRVLDRISANDECGAGASTDRQDSGAAGYWMLADGQPQKIGILSGADDYGFDPLYLTCEGGRGQITLMIVEQTKAKPAKQTVTFNVDGRAIAVPITVSVDEWGAVDASANLGGVHPLLAALPSAQNIRMTVAGRTLPLPVKGLKSNWSAFKRGCGIR
ncbi:hypothetical protein [Sphingomonas colocasiae]|uniref:Lipoprotein n=1 Tax=Sphingomonas colocasiae TaxID=1848973 RepID=A0ABS7PUD3_9SPHN|nr:hypothetical protein [Sphingomonas colocasiae]MBY8824280.1 hypothetical protein [Sphingomonas colocasiae]